MDEESLEKLEKPNPAFVREVPVSFLESLKRIEKKEADAAAEQEKKQAAAEANAQSRIKSAVEAAVAAEQAKFAEARAAEVKAAEADAAEPAGASDQPAAAQTVEAAPAGASTGAGPDIDWSGVQAKTVTLFYPGQASFEWVQTGKDHGGARAFAKLGDRCASCHAKEVRDMGAKIVSGEKAEPTPIPGKRGHVDLKLQAVHAGDMLHMRFQWPDAGIRLCPSSTAARWTPTTRSNWQ